MQTRSIGPSSLGAFGGVGAPHILLAAQDLAVRLTLSAVLERCGFLVETASSAAEAEAKIEQGVYDMVLCDLEREGAAVRERVLRTAKAQQYQPATALLEVSPDSGHDPDSDEVFIEPVDIPQLLTQITDLMASRAYGRAARRSRQTVA
jgi:CheY-like chemotaxis protein